MGASTAGVLSFKSISYSQNLVLVKIFWACLPSVGYSNLQHRVVGSSKATPFGVWGGPEKDRNVCVFVTVGLYACSPRIRLAN